MDTVLGQLDTGAGRVRTHFRSSMVVCDFSRRGSNAFYEVGTAHMPRRRVIPIT